MLSDWWNGVELWVTGLAFPFQFALVMAVLAPLCLIVAWLIDRVVDHASALFGTSRAEEPPLGATLPEHAGQETGEDTEKNTDEDAGRVPAGSSGR